MKSKLIFTLGVLFLLLIQGQKSFAQKKKKGEEERYAPNFSYSPEKRDSVASSGMTIALLNPIFSNKDIGNIKNAGSPWLDFAKGMASDIEELLMAKGFKIKGPFNSVDEMVVSDKLNSDFIMRVIIDIEPNLQRKIKQNYEPFVGGYTYKVTQGDGSIGGKVQLTALSCFSIEKLWTKNIDVETKKFSYVGSVKWPTTGINPILEMRQDVNLWNPACKILDEIYMESLGILYKQFEKEELIPVAAESRKTDKARRGD